jgi:DNA-binding XRE family transcriptional regulator
MKDNLKLIRDEINIFHEGRKRRVFVGKLKYIRKSNQYELLYDKDYAYSEKAIPLGHELSLLKLHHISETGILFPSFEDRIPSKDNPAYKDYCKSQGISVDENNPIILLGSIGKRGPSSFIFESVYSSEFNAKDIKKIRQEIGITQHDLAKALNINRATLARLETGKSNDFNTLKRIEIFFKFPDVALWQLKQTAGWLHNEVLANLFHYFKNI